MTTQNIEELRNLYSITGDVKDINTVLVQRNELQTQAERIKTLEADVNVCGVGAGCCAQATKIDALEEERDTLRAEVEAVRKANLDCVDHYNDARAESETLRAQLDAIAATEPEFVWLYCETCEGSGKVYGESQFGIPGSGGNRPCPDCNANGYIESKLFTRPMPAQDVTELVESLEKIARLGNGEHYGNSDGNMIARTALSKYKGAK